MVNVHSSDTIAEDLIRAIAQLGTTEMHLKTLIEKYEAELNNGLVEPESVETHLEKLTLKENMLNDITELRRQSMVKLTQMYPNGNKEEWCTVKHLLIANMQLFECYQASNKEADFYNLWMESNKKLIQAMSIFLGQTITECSACFGDMLKGEK